VRIRAATPADLEDMGKMAGELVRLHHSIDPKRFFTLEGIERGYARFFESQLPDPDTILIIAEMGGRAVGYAYARLEPRDWNSLLDSCGALHDIFVVESERRHGIAARLLEDVASRLKTRGAPRLVLSTAAGNEPAQRFFERHGFRRTMIEMTRELDETAIRTRRTLPPHPGGDSGPRSA
jgi:ribosomal protein S18 acetylase RimI-like enzyme